MNNKTHHPNVNDNDTEEFLQKCQPKLLELEKIRESKLKIYEFRKKISVPLGAAIIGICGPIDYWLLLLQSGNDDGGAGITVIAIVSLWRWVTSPKRQYATAYKKDILPDISKLFGPFTYEAKGKIDMGIMKQSKIIPSHTKYKTEDYFKGCVKDVGIEFSEMKLTKRKGAGKNKRTVTVFKGLVIRLQLNHKRFLGHTILDKNQNKFSEWFKEKNSKLKRANLVDPEFENLFDVYTDDQVEARYLIDPEMIENIKALYIEYNGEKMAAAFYDKQLLILIASKHNHFEPADIYVHATSPKSILSMKKEIERILSIVDKLSLYNPHDIRNQSQ